MPRPLQVVIWTATQSFQFGGQCGSNCSIRIPSLKFVYNIPKIWLISNHSIYPSGDLPPFDMELVFNITRGMDKFPANFVACVTFLCQVMGKHTSNWRYVVITSTFDLWGHRVCRWCGSTYSVPVLSLKFVGLPLRNMLRIFRLGINRPKNLDLWPFDP